MPDGRCFGQVVIWCFSSLAGRFCRDYKQYYYMNNETGQSQWEYPITKADLPLEFGASKTEEANADNSSDVEEVSG